MRKSTAITRGTIVFQESHGYIAPVQLNGTTKRVLPTVNKSISIQSILLNFVLRSFSMGLRRMKKNAKGSAMPIMGRLIQSIQRHVAYSLQSASMMGPRMRPVAIGMERRPIQSARSFNVVISATMTSLKTSSPPPLMPCKTLPKMAMPMVGAVAKTMEPMPKRLNAK